MRLHLGMLVEDLRRRGRERAVVRHVGNRRRVTSYGELVRLGAVCGAAGGAGYWAGRAGGVVG